MTRPSGRDGVVVEDDDAVGRPPDVELDAVGPHGDGQSERRGRVLGRPGGTHPGGR